MTATATPRPPRGLFSRQNRQRFLPAIVFAAVLGCTIVLWNKHEGRSSLVGQAEIVHTTVTATRAGTVATLNVDRLQRVKRGEIIAQLVPGDLEAVTAHLTADVEKLRADLGQSVDRNLVNYQNLRLDWLRRNVDLAAARVDLQFAESEYQRYAALHESKMVSDAEFETRRNTRDAVKGKVAGLQRLSSDLEKEIGHLKPANSPQSDATDRAISAAMISQQKQLEALVADSTLRAPMDGVVTAIEKRPGENAAPGDLVVTLGALEATRIIAYVRQPLDTQLKAGDMVDVTARTAKRATAPAHVLQVGTQLEPIDAALLPLGTTSQKVVEYGLPVLVEIPATLKLAPGEIVNVTPRNGS